VKTEPKAAAPAAPPPLVEEVLAYVHEPFKFGGQFRKPDEIVALPPHMFATLKAQGLVSDQRRPVPGEIEMPPEGVSTVKAVVTSTLRRSKRSLQPGEKLELSRDEYVTLATLGCVRLG